VENILKNGRLEDKKGDDKIAIHHS